MTEPAPSPSASPSPLAPLSGRFVWHGATLAETTGWIRPFAAAEIAEIEAALAAVTARGLPLLAITRDDFPLPGLAPGLAAISREIEEGRGFILLRGLPVARWGIEAQRRVFWGLGTHLGQAVSQSQAGELLGEVRDMGVRLGQPTSRGYRSREHLRFHTDRCDVVALFCSRTARSGGLSRIVSTAAIHNAMLARRPDLLALLYEPYYHSRQGEEAPGEARFYANPVFGRAEGRFTSQYSRSYIESAQRFPEVPRLTAAQDQALDLLAALAEELCFEMALEPGDIQLLNNHVTYHSRTGYEDYPEPERQRLLLRLWLSVPESRPLPPGFEVLWGAIAAGALRGGVTAAAGYRNIADYRRMAPLP